MRYQSRAAVAAPSLRESLQSTVALMAASILNSERAIAMSVYVIRAFVEIRERLATNAVILKRLAEIDKTLVLHGTALSDIYQKLLPLLSPPPDPPRRQIGFTRKL
jgi:hypothetical protein